MVIGVLFFTGTLICKIFLIKTFKYTKNRLNTQNFNILVVVWRYSGLK